ncbi:bifunctional ADP-dependent NAD(P)H-hydrate dehydratase/NAD(P)H-hydrate epimerase [Corynebacterium mayonis]|uniref:bifunctional ADP-dependent NAD(P)H-hydrate dehydratase/NAD(P)H-hydrate epimerase n=1 Tax=Corynebacterium mayonis TaxID=3062461 RepID=UPI003140B256
MVHKAYTAQQIRAAEKPLLDGSDTLMKSAAHAVARVAEAMLQGPSRVVVLAGKGGNGGDALYAGAELALAGHRVEAWCVFGAAHSRALEAFSDAGGTLVDAPRFPADLLIDGVVGLGAAGSLPESLVGIGDLAEKVLAVDVPSGIAADTGEAAPVHISADVTVTFGGWRLAHALAAQCGTALLADIPPLVMDGYEPTWISRATAPAESFGLTALGPVISGSLEPGARDDKYTGGVVGIRAGSSTYPGAAVLCAAGAVAATSAMVRYAGPQAAEVVRAHPEIVVASRLEDTGRVHAWVYGPGAGDGASELEWLLARREPLLIDADGISLLARHEHLRLRLRQRESYTVLTPHDGEAARLGESAGVIASDRFTEAKQLADLLHCTVVRKGRASIIARAGNRPSYVVDAGNSWAATPGSGDVLAGVAGARLARAAVMGADADDAIFHAVQVHGLAAKLAAETKFGPAPTCASGIAAHIREATALLTEKQPSQHPRSGADETAGIWC